MLKNTLHNLRTVWFENWHPDLDSALENLPEMDNCPHDLFRELMQTPGNAPKRTVLITRSGSPIAVVGLKKTGRYSWELATNWIIPGAPFPVYGNNLLSALEGLNVEVSVAWWRIQSLPSSRWIRSRVVTPTYRLVCSDDYESFWKKNGYWKTVKQSRNRCRNFVSQVNYPGSAEWVIKNWAERWSIRHDNSTVVDRIVVAKYLEERGRHLTVSMFDQDKLIGGATMIVHQGDLVASVLYYENEYRWHGLGVRLINESLSVAKVLGFGKFDIGGGHDYKKMWAPQEGEHYWFTLSPGFIYFSKQAINKARLIFGGVRKLRG